MSIGFRPSNKRREPVYTASSRKVGYLETRADGAWFTDLDGKLIARISRYHIELAAASSSCSGSYVITPDPLYEG